MHCAILALAADALGSPNEVADVPVNVQCVCVCVCVLPAPCKWSYRCPCKMMTDCWQNRIVTTVPVPGRSGVTIAEFEPRHKAMLRSCLLRKDLMGLKYETACHSKLLDGSSSISDQQRCPLTV